MSRFAILLGQRMRRDWRQLLMWIIGTGILAYLSFTAVAESYATVEARVGLLAAVMANPVILVFRGLPSGPDEGAVMVFLIFGWLALLAALMSTFLAVRHTRMDEEDGRAEQVAATPAGRVLPVVATAVHGTIANAALAALVALAYLSNGLPVAGSVLVGAASGSVGFTFLGVALFGAQLWRTSRSANAFAVWVTVGSLLVAGVGNAMGTATDDLTRIESSPLTWLSPFGWGENTRAFADDAVWPVLLCLGAGSALTLTAIALASVRDVGESFIAQRHGRADATGLLAGPQSLVWRLNRGAIIGWTVGGLFTGLLSTTLASAVDQITDNPAVAQILASIAGGGDLNQATVTVFFTMLGILAASAAVQIGCRARQEEAHGTAEPILTAPVARVRWLADYLIVGAASILLVVAAAVGGAAAGIASQGGEWSLMRAVLVTGGGQAVAGAVFLVITSLLFVTAPRATIPIGWALVLLGMVLGLFGPLFGFPEWMVNLSPVGVAPQLVGDRIEVDGLWWLVAVVAVAGSASLALMRRRELATEG